MTIKDTDAGVLIWRWWKLYRIEGEFAVRIHFVDKEAK